MSKLNVMSYIDEKIPGIFCVKRKRSLVSLNIETFSKPIEPLLSIEFFSKRSSSLDEWADFLKIFFFRSSSDDQRVIKTFLVSFYIRKNFK